MNRKIIHHFMKTIILTTGIVSATLLGFVFAGITGAVLFGGILTFSVFLIRKINKKKVSVVNMILLFTTLSALGYGLMTVFGLLGSDQKVMYKLSLIEKDLIEKNYKPSWVIISQKRYKTFNSILRKSVDGSHHLKGIAVDIYVFDINGDGEYNASDITILENSVNDVEKIHPELIGGLGDYYFLKNNGYLTKHMIHIDTRGTKRRFTK